MKKKMSFMAALLAATVLSGGAYAKTLVYCSEASPANFDPGTTTGGNDFDASRAPSIPAWSSSSMAAPRSSRALPKAGKSPTTA